MLIDWFTVVAQVLNFLVLVWLLKRFLYKPILAAIDVREQRIARDVADAAIKQQQAQAARDEFADKKNTFDQQRGAMLLKAAADATVEHDRLLQQAREAADALSKSRHDALLTEAAQLNQSLLRRTQQEVFVIARKTLSDLADASLEERVTHVFVARLATIDPTIKATMAAAFAASADQAVIRSAFDLPPPQQSAIQQALNKSFATTLGLRFETAPNLIGGIEIMAGGQKLGWTIASYLDSLASGVEDVLEKKPARSQVAMPVAKGVASGPIADVKSAASP